MPRTRTVLAPSALSLVVLACPAVAQPLETHEAFWTPPTAAHGSWCGTIAEEGVGPTAPHAPRLRGGRESLRRRSSAAAHRSRGGVSPARAGLHGSPALSPSPSDRVSSPEEHCALALSAAIAFSTVSDRDTMSAATLW